MIDYHWDLHLPLTSRIVAGAAILVFVTAAIWVARRDRKARTFCVIWCLAGLLIAGPKALDLVPQFIDLRGDTLSFNQSPFPTSKSVKVADVEKIEESRSLKNTYTFHITKKGDLHLLTMPRPEPEAELQKLLEALRSRGIPVTRRGESKPGG